ncbi:hypothetical protein PPACK8108_LOCUS18214 [Phakopsora pachyrhizi]|uniref:Uncharacterized protein n=1 Tax=Phakopsora pachyrhizi TaxID=170000 RepID=A0AAV0BCZ9_PHAPC|nr:hypothetical protein PPACK8108_LOCUS18214 [Phakopsora pachyrhizi]
MTYKSNKTFPWLGQSTTGLQVETQGGKSLGFIISMPITRHRSCSNNLTLIRFPYLSKDLGVSAAELGSKTDFPVSVSVSLLELLINIFEISLTSLTLNHLRKRGQGVEDERTSPTDASVDLQRVIWILTATPQTVIHNQESLIDPTRIRMFLSDSQDTHPKYNSPQVAPKISTSPPAHLPPLPQTVTPLLTTTKLLVKKKSSNSPKPQQRLVTNSHKPEAKKSFIAPQSDACKDQVSKTLVKRLRSQNTASKVADQQEQIKIDKRRQNTKDVQEHTCPVEAIGQTMLNVSQNQSHFECPIVQELTEPVVVDVALLNHVVSQHKGWTEYPLVSESHYKHGMGAGFLTSVSVVLNTRSWFGLLVLVVWNILKNIVLSP